MDILVFLKASGHILVRKNGVDFRYGNMLEYIWCLENISHFSPWGFTLNNSSTLDYFYSLFISKLVFLELKSRVLFPGFWPVLVIQLSQLTLFICVPSMQVWLINVVR